MILNFATAFRGDADNHSMNNYPRSTAYILLGSLTLIWGTSFILIKQGLKVFSPDEVGALRVAAAAVFIAPIAITRIPSIQPGSYWKLFASGMMGIFIPSFLFATAQTRMESSVAGMLNTLTPLFTIIIGAFVFKQRVSGFAIAGAIIGLAGTILISLSRSGGAFVGFNAYALLIVLACLFYASNLNFVKFSIFDMPALTITSGSLLLIGPLALIYLFGFTPFVGKLTTMEGAWKAFGYIVILGLMSTAVATILFNKLVKLTSPLFTSTVTYLIPIVGVMWGVLDGEQLHAGHFLGMISIIGGVYLANMRRKESTSLK
jgi:drug/metabolite transporter (DMT)-like permease